MNTVFATSRRAGCFPMAFGWLQFPNLLALILQSINSLDDSVLNTTLVLNFAFQTSVDIAIFVHAFNPSSI
jgi:hypothetical protein